MGRGERETGEEREPIQMCIPEFTIKATWVPRPPGLSEIPYEMHLGTICLGEERGKGEAPHSSVSLGSRVGLNGVTADL